MKKLVAAGIFIVVLVEVTAIALADREVVLVVVGAMVALVLASLRIYLVREPRDDTETMTNDAAESLRRWLSRTETLVSRADSTRRDWDRHLRPMLARQFELATGQRQLRNHVAFHATGTMLFGAELWQWVDPQNVSRTGESEPGPGREALDEILRRLEQV